MLDYLIIKIEFGRTSEKNFKKKLNVVLSRASQIDGNTGKMAMKSCNSKSTNLALGRTILILLKFFFKLSLTTLVTMFFLKRKKILAQDTKK